DQRLAKTVAARVSQLQANDEIAIAANLVAMGLAALAEHLFQRRSGLVVDEQLARVGASLVEDGGCLAPDQLGAAAAEATITTKGEFIRPAVEGAVATFHRLH